MGCGPHCNECVLEKIGKGFTRVEVGKRYEQTKLLLIGEASGDSEARDSLPFRPYGQSGSLLVDAMREMNISREEVAITNIIRCRPPQDVLEGAWYQHKAIHHCVSHYLDDVIKELKPNVILTLGGVAFRSLTEPIKGRSGTLDYIRGYAIPGGGAAQGITIIPTYHPAFLRRGAAHLTPLLQRDLRRAFLIATGRLNAGTHYILDPLNAKNRYQITPSVDEAWNWLRKIDPTRSIYADIETPRSRREDEDDRNSFADRDINLIQFSQRRGEGIALPWRDDYVEIARSVLATNNRKVGHNWFGFDLPVLAANGVVVNGVQDDTMLMFHHYHPDLPQNLQAVAQYCGFPFAWKHLSEIEPEFYGCVDVDATCWADETLSALLERENLWLSYVDLVREFYPGLREMSRRGYPIDEQKRLDLKHVLMEEREKTDAEIKALVPEEVLKSKHAKGGYKNPPKLKCEECGYEGREDHLCKSSGDISGEDEEGADGDDNDFIVKYSELAEQNGLVEREVVVGEDEKCRCTKKTRELCPDCAGTGIIPVGTVERRWTALTEFNPNSPHQVKKFMRFLKHPVPKHQKRIDANGDAAETTEVKELERLYAKTKHPIYPLLIQKRQITKIDGTYCEGWKPGRDGRIHTTFTLKPATLQTSSREPNCFSADTEILTNRGWVLFPFLQPFDLCAQFDTKHYTIDFATPLAFINKPYNGELLNIKTEEQIDLLVTNDHDCLLRHRKAFHFYKVPACNYSPDAQQWQAGEYVGGLISMRESQIALICALQADGHVRKARGRDVGGQYMFRFVKERKIRRFLSAIEDEEIAYTEHVDNRGGRKFYIANAAIPSWWRNKKFFDSWILALDRESLTMMEDEVWFWDGCYSRRSMFASKQKKNADWVQIIAILTNRRAKIRAYNPNLPGRAISWQVDASSKAYSMTANTMRTPIKYKGQVYCVTMPKGTVIVRRNGKVSITGNCQNGLKHGKTPFQKRLAKAFAEMQRAELGHVMVNIDAKSFHAQTTACEAGLPDMLRLAKIDVHSFTTCHYLKLPERIGLYERSDEEMKDIFKRLKKDEKFKFTRDYKAKRTFLGIMFAMGPTKLFNLNPDDFENIAEAKAIHALIMKQLFPGLEVWQNRMRAQAAKEKLLRNRYDVIRRFYDVQRWDRKQQKWVGGDQAEAAVAFLPASNAFGYMRKVIKRIRANGWDERYQLVNSIHDSLVFHCPKALVEECAFNVTREISKPALELVYPSVTPFGLSVEAEATVGESLAEMEEIRL